MAGRSGIGGAEIPVARTPEETGGMDLMTALRLQFGEGARPETAVRLDHVGDVVVRKPHFRGSQLP
jgi:hypothetical protein